MSAPKSSSRSASPRRGRAAAAASTTSSGRGSSSRSATRAVTRSGWAAGSWRGRGPKYLNSPATPLFDKSRTLYLIDRAKGPIRRQDQAVIVEGYTDALMAHQAGFDNVVASLGTALTPGQVALLTRYAKRIVLAYDVDAAGEKAGTLGVTALAELIRQLQSDSTGVKLEDVRVARLPDGKDPDEVVRETPDAWRDDHRRGQAARRVPHRPPRRRFDLKTPTGRMGFVDAVMPSLRDIADPLRRDEALLRGPPRVGGRGAHPPPGPRAPARGDGPGPCRRPAVADHRRLRARLAGRPADRTILRAITAGRVGAAAAPPARPGPAAAGRGGARAGPAALDRSPASCSGRSSSSASPTTRASTRHSTVRRSCSRSTTKRRRSLGRCMPSRVPIRGRSTPINSTTRSIGCSCSSRTTGCATAANTTRPPRGRPNGPATPRRSPDSNSKDDRSTKRAGHSTDVETRPGCFVSHRR